MHCAQGKSRSATLAAAFISWREGVDIPGKSSSLDSSRYGFEVLHIPPEEMIGQKAVTINLFVALKVLGFGGIKNMNFKILFTSPLGDMVTLTCIFWEP